MKLPFKILVVAVALLVVAGATALYNMAYNVTLEAKDISSFRVEESMGTRPLRLRISGLPFYSGMVVRSVTAKTKGSVTTVTVHLATVGLAKPKMPGGLEYELTIPDSVNEVRFGTSSIPIWKRERPQQASMSGNSALTELAGQENEHLLDGNYSIITDTVELPENIKLALAEEFQQERLDMANPGDQFNAGDVGLPGRRLIFAGLSKERCFVHYEKGGIALTYGLLVLERNAQKPRVLWFGSGFRANDLQQLRLALASGKFAGTSR